MLGELYARGVLPGDGAKLLDAERAIYWYSKAAAKSNPNALFRIGELNTARHRSSNGTPSDAENAATYYRRAAALGLAEAQFALAVAYRNGEGLPQDYSEAVNWYHQAAAQGLAEAEFNLGGMYRRGEGISKSPQQAMTWYRRAAGHGNIDAMVNLGAMYGGRGVPTPDYVRAHVWSNLAAAKGAKDAEVNREYFEVRLSQGQLSEAHRLARECLASKYKQCGEPAEHALPPAP